MTRPLTIIIAGKPEKQDRPRVTVIKGHGVVYDTKESKDAKKRIAEATEIAVKAQKWESPTNEPLAVVVAAYFPYLKSWTKKELSEVVAGITLPTCKPDLDNIAKVYLDGLVSGGAFRDDALVTEMHCYKYYAKEPRTIVTVHKVGKNNG